MKFKLFTLLALLVAGFANAVAQPVGKAVIEPTEGQTWWGYYEPTLKRLGTGRKDLGRWDACMYIDQKNAVVVGKKIKAISLYLRAKEGISDFRIWLSKTLPTDMSKVDYEKKIDVNTMIAGDTIDYATGFMTFGTRNDLELDSAFKVGPEGVFVGYSFNVESIDEDWEYNRQPLVCTIEKYNENSFFVRHSVSEGLTEWKDLQSMFGCLALRVLVEGDFENNAVNADQFYTQAVRLDSTINVPITFTNIGAAGVKNFDYTISTNGVAGDEQHMNLEKEVSNVNDNFVCNIPFKADAKAGVTKKTLTITKVNGKPNTAKEPTANGQLVTVDKPLARRIVIEENTGNTCEWCPRGAVGLDKTHAIFGDKVTIIGVHQFDKKDPMYIPNYFCIRDTYGAPFARINRNAKQIDPYYGTDTNYKKYEFDKDVNREMANVATTSITLKANFNNDSTAVTATAGATAIVDSKYQWVFVLVGDSLASDSKKWLQKNGYSINHENPAKYDDDLKVFCPGNTLGQNYIKTVYNHVALASSYDNDSKNTIAYKAFKANENAEQSFTLPMPTATELLKAVKNGKVHAVAMLVREDGIVDNAAQVVVEGQLQSSINTVVTNAQAHEVARYTLDGRQIATPQMGINIIKMSDGSVLKVLVK